MSYYSDAAVVLYKEDWEIIKNKIIKDFEADNFELCTFNRNIKVEKDDIIIVKWESVNHWDEVYHPFVEELLDFIKTVPSYYIRIGEWINEDSVDIERRDYNLTAENFGKFCRIGISYNIDIY